MLGHLKPTLCGTNPQHKAQYQEMYCSICAFLRRENHVGYSFLLSHELTLVMLALREYLPAPTPIRTSCPAKAFLATQKAQQHTAIDRAGKLSIVLGWIKVTDSATDRPRFYKTWLKNVLHHKVKRILPELSDEAQAVIAHYGWLTKSNATDFEEVVHYSGLLSEVLVMSIGELTTLPADKLKQLASLFRLQGALIATADHLIDAEKDLAQNQYNPIFYQAKMLGISWNEAYWQLHTQYNQLKIQISTAIQAIQKEGFASPAWVAMLYKALQNLDKSVQKHQPYFAQLEADHHFASQKLVYAKADCGSCDCSCDGCECPDGCCNCCDCCSSCDGCSGCNGCECNSKSPSVKKEDDMPS